MEKGQWYRFLFPEREKNQGMKKLSRLQVEVIPAPNPL
jgi:hypothetical protein